MQTNPTEIHGEVGYLRTLKSPSTDLVRQFYTRNPTLKNFESRVGFAWDAFHDGKTALRGGFGIFDSLPQPYINNLYNATAASFLGNYGTVGPPSTASPPPGVWPYEVPALAATIRPTQVVWAYNDNNIKRNYVYQWNLSIQRQLTSDTTVVVGYIGSRGYRSTPSAWTRHGRWESRSPSWSAPSRAYFNSFFAPIRDCLMRISCRRPAHLERD